MSQIPFPLTAASDAWLAGGAPTTGTRSVGTTGFGSGGSGGLGGTGGGGQGSGWTAGAGIGNGVVACAVEAEVEAEAVGGLPKSRLGPQAVETETANVMAAVAAVAARAAPARRIGATGHNLGRATLNGQVVPEFS